MQQFPEVTRVIFSRWTALSLAVENQWGGPRTQQKADDMLQETLDIFSGAKPGQKVHADELEDLFYDYFSNEFHVGAEDGSIEEVSL
jgi:pre-rRNA-processing protein TSR2